MVIKNVCFIGAGHVGAPTATILAFFNPTLHVNVADKSEPRIRKWNSRHIPLSDESGLHYLVRVTRDGTWPTLVWTDDQIVERPARKANLVFSVDVEGCIRKADMVFLCVETPTRSESVGSGMAVDTGPLEKAVESVAKWAKKGVILVLKSTVPVGMAAKVREMISMIRPELVSEVLSNPEFLSEGEAVKNLLDPDRILIGSACTRSGRLAASALADMYSSWVDPTKVQRMSCLSAELTKLAANAMLAQRISSINAISNICERTGADITDVQVAIGSDHRLGSDYLRAGIGFGGSCFKKDILSLVHLAESFNLSGIGEYWSQILRINQFQCEHFVQRVVSRLDGSLLGKKIVVFGWAFKKGTSDGREARSSHVIEALLKDSVTSITVFDPGCDPAAIQEQIMQIEVLANDRSERPDNIVEVHDNPYTACEGADAILMLTDWDQFRCLPEPNRPPLFLARDSPDRGSVGSASHFSWTDGAPSDVGLSLSKLSIHETGRMGGCNSFVMDDPLGRLKPDLPCPSDCKDCIRKPSCGEGSNDQVDWKRICGVMKSPRWVFDGRNVLDIFEMEKLGFTVEAIGKVSAWEHLERRGGCHIEAESSSTQPA